MFPPMGTEVGEPVLVTARSATGVTVVVTEAELFAIFGSGSAALTVIVLVMDGTAPACGIRIKAMVKLAPLERGLPRVQMIIAAGRLHETPAGMFAAKKVTFAGRV